MFLSTSNEVMLLINTPAGYVLRYIFFDIVNWTNVAIRQTSDTLIPSTMVNIANNEIYCLKMEHNTKNNKIFILFSKSVVGYTADILLTYSGHHILNIFDVWKNLDMSVSNKNADLLVIMEVSETSVYNVSTFKELTFWVKIS